MRTAICFVAYLLGSTYTSWVGIFSCRGTWCTTKGLVRVVYDTVPQPLRRGMKSKKAQGISAYTATTKEENFAKTYLDHWVERLLI